MRSAQPDMRTWERAEVTRSAAEASTTADAALRMSALTRQRYRAPMAETTYPLEYAYHLLGDVRGRVVLDFGCGSGANSMLLAGRGALVIGVDISDDLLQLARRRLAINGAGEDCRFVVGSAHDLPLPDDSVDVVFGMAILHHLDLDLVAREVYRVLRPGGRAIFEEPVRNSRALRLMRRLVPLRSPDVSPFERPLTDAELRRFTSRFDHVRVRAFGLPHVRLAKRLRLRGGLQSRAYASDGRLLRRWPALARYAAVRVLEVRRPMHAC
ncbi:MAG TPA: methyltransferase domain-containing protein [Vicinamibacterales bacterium]|nr:methyltransferase domain-containing protein [Vicinamibacterales bacterium]